MEAIIVTASDIRDNSVLSFFTPHSFGKADKLDRWLFTSYGLAWSFTSESILMLSPHNEACFCFKPR